MRHRDLDDLARLVAVGEQALAGLDPEMHVGEQTNLRWELRISVPGSRPASVTIWKPLQMPSTGTPCAARA